MHERTSKETNAEGQITEWTGTSQIENAFVHGKRIPSHAGEIKNSTEHSYISEI